MATLDLVQGSEEWIKARCGSVGASRIADVVARTKSGYGASRANLMAELICERLTGCPAKRFVSSAMVHGTETEPEARNAYAFYFSVKVEQVGIIPHPTIANSHASPDGLVDTDGLVEIKCPGSAAHIDTLLGKSVPGNYVKQMYWQMACTGRQWCDFVSFDPRMPEHLKLFVRRLPRDPMVIAELESEVRQFLRDLDAKITELNSLSIEAAA